MVVTELALLHIADTNQSVATLRPSLAKIRSTLRKGAGHDFSLYQDDGGRRLLILGTWDSVEQHGIFLQSPANKELLQMCAGCLEVKWMVHVDTDLTEVKSKHWLRLTAGPQEDFRGDKGKGEAQGAGSKVWAATLGDDSARFAGFEVAWAQDQVALQQKDKSAAFVGLFEELDVE